jgi:hypothetical protein
MTNTTDMSTLKQLAILVTYFDMESFASKQYLLDMVEIGDGTAEGIYPAVHISMENIIGYSSETTNGHVRGTPLCVKTLNNGIS